jgi:hypothetical protein
MTTPSTVNSSIAQHCPTCSFIRMRQTSSSSNKVHVSLTTIISGFRVSMTFHIISFLLLILWVLTIIVVSLFAGFDTIFSYCQTYHRWTCAKYCSLNTTHSNMHDNPINGQQFYCSALSDDQIDPPDSPQCTSTPVKSVRNKSEKIVSKPANLGLGDNRRNSI